MQYKYILIFFILFTVLYFINDNQDPTVNSNVNNKVYSRENKSHYKIGCSVINIDGKEALFLGGNYGKGDSLLMYNDESKILEDKIKGTGISSKEPTYAAVSFDINNNGKDDLIICRPSGVYIYLNEGNMKFKEKKIYSDFKDREPTSISISDVNKNKLPDIYISTYISHHKYIPYQFNNKTNTSRNVLLINKGNLEFEDQTFKYNAEGEYNTNTACFVDFGSGNPDLILANDTGLIQILINKNGHFTSIYPFKKYGCWQGLAVGDYNNNGKLDLFFTNIGNNHSINNIKGDKTKNGIYDYQEITNKHLLLENKNNYIFEDVSKKANVDDYAFGNGAVLEDINLNGKLDIIFSQNYIIPDFNTTKKGEILVNHNKMNACVVLENKNNKYKRINRFVNRNPSQTPISIDFNSDGIKDLVWVNSCGNIFGYIVNNYHSNNFINIRLPNNVKYVNATVTVHHKNTSQMRQHIIGGIGSSSDQSHLLSFGLGKIKFVDRINILTIYGDNVVIDNPKINRTTIISK